MEQPHLKVVERQNDIPVKARCSSCADVEFTAIPRSVEKNQHLLDLMFADHFKRVHVREGVAGQ
jgi:hypothetical protein